MMRKLVLILLCAALSFGFSFGKKKQPQLPPEEGYSGQLPSIKKELEYNLPSTSTKEMFNTDGNNKDFSKLKLAPIENMKYLDVIVKKGKTSKYVNDTYELNNVLEKLKKTIENKSPIMHFNAQVSTILDQAGFIQEKYATKPESSYASYRKLTELTQFARNTATLKMQAQTYNKYLSYNEQGAVYRPENIAAQDAFLLKLINETISLIKSKQ